MIVWINRHNAKETIKKIDGMGIKCIWVPLVTMQYYEFKLDKSYEVAIFTSANAAMVVPRYIKKAIVVGEKSKKLLENKGVEVIASFSNVVSLLNFLRSNVLENVIYLRGKHVTKDLKSLIGCDEKVVYDMIPRKYSSDELKFVSKVDCTLIYSKRTALLMRDMILKHSILTRNMVLIAISKSVAEMLIGLDFKDIITADYPNESSMLKALKRVKERYNGEKQN